MILSPLKELSTNTHNTIYVRIWLALYFRTIVFEFFLFFLLCPYYLAQYFILALSPAANVLSLSFNGDRARLINLLFLISISVMLY
jgi:hypothetical protein